ncbi:unnamed protein product [Closterium sp. Naga37s-1]|nr:unnamed protein product [Closterium sp. Naga37s-1]
MLLEDIRSDTVDFAPNFDSSTNEPTVLPARIPVLLLNGSQGIAVGMATNIPPHNLTELVDALSAFIDNPAAPSPSTPVTPYVPPCTPLHPVAPLQVGMATNIPPHNLTELVDALSAFIDNPAAPSPSTPVTPYVPPCTPLHPVAPLQVGMATNIPPHNLTELVDALSAFIDNPAAPSPSTPVTPYVPPCTPLHPVSPLQVGMATNIPPHNLTELVDALSAFIDNPAAPSPSTPVTPYVPPCTPLHPVAPLQVGMATNIPPHNLTELVDALSAFIDNPAITTEQLMLICQGPDFPTGGVILGTSGSMEEAYRTGRGSIVVRGRAYVEEHGGGVSHGKRVHSGAGEGLCGGAGRRGSGEQRQSDWHCHHRVVRGRAYVEELGGGGAWSRGNRLGIVITELPYQTNKAALVEKMAELVNSKVVEGTNKAALVEKMAELVNSKVVEGVSDIRDESDRAGMRVVVEVKRGATPMAVLASLYKHTQLQSRFNCNLVGLVNGEPKEMTLRDFFQVFLDFRCQVIERRTSFQLRKAEDREHYVQGLLIGLGSLDRMVDILKAAATPADAAATLQQALGLSPIQADALLSTPLRRLTSLEVSKLEEEHSRLKADIADLQGLLASRKRILQTVKREALALKDEFGGPRRTRIEADGTAGDLDPSDVIPNATVLLNLSERGYVKRMAADTFSAQKRGTAGKSGGKLKADDAMARFVVCRTHDTVLFFSDRGVAYTMKGYQIPEGSRTAIGSPISQIVPLQDSERITSMLPVGDFSEDAYLVMMTRGGFIKRTALHAFSDTRKSGLIAIQLGDGDELAWVRRATAGDSLLVGSQFGNIVRFACDDDQLRQSGRTARGVRAMRLREGDIVAALEIVPSVASESKDGGPWVVMATRNGMGKRVPTNQFANQRRGGVGVKGIKLGQGDALVVLRLVGEGTADRDGVDTATEAGAAMEYGELLVGSDGGIINRLRVRDIPILSRTTRGCRLMRIASGDSLASLSLVPGAAEGELEEDGVPLASLSLVPGAAEGELEEDGVPLVVPEGGVSDEESEEEKVEGESRVKAKVVLASLSLVPGAAEGELEEDGVPLVVPEGGVSDEEGGEEMETHREHSASLASLSLVPGAAGGDLDDNEVPLVVPEGGVSDEEKGESEEEKMEGESRVVVGM